MENNEFGFLSSSSFTILILVGLGLVLTVTHAGVGIYRAKNNKEYHQASDETIAPTQDLLTIGSRRTIAHSGPVEVHVSVPLAWAIGACVCFGLTHWLTGLLQQPEHSSAWVGVETDTKSVIQMMCAWSSLISALISQGAMMTSRGESLSEEYAELFNLRRSMTRQILIWIVGPLHYAALAFQRAFLDNDFDNAAPLLAVVSSDAIVVALISDFVFKQRLHPFEFFFIGVTIAGNFCSSWSVGMSQYQYVQTKSVGESLIAMLLFACAAIAINQSASLGFSPLSSFVIRCQGIGLATLIHSLLFAPGRYHISCEFTLWCLLAAITHDVGIYCVIQALQFPFAGVCVAVWGSNSVVVFVLNAVALHIVPSPLAIVGMSISIVGLACSAVATMYRPKLDPETTNQAI
jgi:drug/metabolite transporter (DMT)-like permease